jgi:hypothetical protein
MDYSSVVPGNLQQDLQDHSVGFDFSDVVTDSSVSKVGAAFVDSASKVQETLAIISRVAELVSAKYSDVCCGQCTSDYTLLPFTRAGQLIVYFKVSFSTVR